jgi:TolB-like protein/DNA-binding winged helix-turn-helix (wHTH) protein
VSIYRFGVFELDIPGDGLKNRSGATVKLQPQPLKLLELLVRRAGEVVTREDIQQHLWANQTFVDFEHSVNFCMRQIRAALGDDAKSPRYIETIPRRGYRFIAALDTSENTTQESLPSLPVPDRRLWLAVVALSVAVIAILLWQNSSRTEAGAGPEPMVVAVLPFQEVGIEVSEGHIDEGLTGEVISQLGRVRPDRLRVIARNSAMALKGSPRDIPAIAKRVGADYILQGSITRANGRIRVTTQLFRARDANQIWSQTYERGDSDLLRLQADVARDAAGALTNSVLRETAGPKSVNAGAEDAYLKGRYLWNRGTLSDLKDSLVQFGRAIELDPGFALAHSASADVYQLLANNGAMDARDTFTKAKVAAARAIELNPMLDEAHAAMGTALFRLDWNWNAAELEFQRALEINPSSAPARHDYAWFLISMRRFDEGISQMETARALDPLSPRVNVDVGWAYLRAGRVDAAITHMERMLDLEPSLMSARQCLEAAYTYRNMYGKALEAARKDFVRRGIELEGIPGYRANDAEASMKAIWKWRLRALQPGNYRIAAYHALLGDRAEAIGFLERALEERDPEIVAVHIDEAFAKLRTEAQFQSLVRRIGLP